LLQKDSAKLRFFVKSVRHLVSVGGLIKEEIHSWLSLQILADSLIKTVLNMSIGKRLSRGRSLISSCSFLARYIVSLDILINIFNLSS
jgi:hypothetical protein